uniref:Uncharacterized protein n=1 Tax=Cyprinodon variegatus TaxID=28743 RepID=A0A3Q2CXI3_CYPVA
LTKSLGKETILFFLVCFPLKWLESIQTVICAEKYYDPDSKLKTKFYFKTTAGTHVNRSSLLDLSPTLLFPALSCIKSLASLSPCCPSCALFVPPRCPLFC